jgi:hypothetical protein
MKKINISIFSKFILVLGLAAALLNGNIIHFDEELLIALNSLTFFWILYKLTGKMLMNMFCSYSDLIYLTFAFLLHVINLSLVTCKHYIPWIVAITNSYEIWLTISKIQLNVLLNNMNLGVYSLYSPSSILIANGLKNFTHSSASTFINSFDNIKVSDGNINSIIN